MLSLANAFSKEDLINFEKNNKFYFEKVPLKFLIVQAKNRRDICIFNIQKWKVCPRPI